MEILNRTERGIAASRACNLLGISRSSLSYEPADRPRDKQVCDAIDTIFTKCPFYGVPKMRAVLRRDHGIIAGIDRVRRLMRLMGLMAIHPKLNLSKPCPTSQIYPYLLKNFTITRPNQVWATDITYIRLEKGWCYLVAIIDWHSRYVLSWRLSKTLELPFCLEALNEAIATYGTPDIFNSDQGSHFTAIEWIAILKDNGIRISMDGRGRYWDNIFTERFWRSVKYENVYLKGYRTYDDANTGIGEYMRFFNTERPHESLNYRTPHEVHFSLSEPEKRGHRIAQEQRNEHEMTFGSCQRTTDRHAEAVKEKQRSLFNEIAIATGTSDQPNLNPYLT